MTDPGITPDTPDDFAQLDDLIDGHFDGPGDDAAPEPEPTDDLDPEDTLEDSPEDYEDDELGGEEDLAEEDEEDWDEDDDDDLDDDEEYDDDAEGEQDDEDDGEEDEEEDVLTSVTAEEHARIAADPALSKLHKLMQRDYTKKTQTARDLERKVEAREQGVERFEKALATPRGMADYLADTLDRRPDVVGAAFEAVATGDNGRDFLVEVALANPEVMEEAYERFQDLSLDDHERQQHIRERDQRMREAELDRREERQARNRFDRDLEKLNGTVEQEAKRLGLLDEDLPDVQAALKEKIKGSVNKDGAIQVSRKEARKVVRDVRAQLKRAEERARKRLNRGKVKESQSKAKKAARKARGAKRVPPRGTNRRAPKQGGRFTPPDKGDALDAFIDQRLAG